MQKETFYEWPGSQIMRRTAIPSKRRVIGNEDVLIPTDLREWITSSDSQEIRLVIADLDFPTGKELGEFDQRARLVWQFVIEHVKYCPDEIAQRKLDFWQFPAETLALGKGDCEDCAFLLASLLLASGISPFCVRVVFGTLTQEDGSPVAHAWPIYKDENGGWRILESTLEKLPDEYEWPWADYLARLNSLPRYRPEMCLNRDHVWAIGPRRTQDVTVYLASRKRRMRSRTRC